MSGFCLFRGDGWCTGHAGKVVDHVISHNDTIVNRSQPAGHDNPATAGVIQTWDLLRQSPADSKAFELGAETGSIDVLCVVLESDWGRDFRMSDSFSTVGNIFF